MFHPFPLHMAIIRMFEWVKVYKAQEHNRHAKCGAIIDHLIMWLRDLKIINTFLNPDSNEPL